MNNIELEIERARYEIQKLNQKSLKRWRLWNYFCGGIAVLTFVFYIIPPLRPFISFGVGIVCAQAFFYNLEAIRDSKRREQECKTI